jgi:hypothetical protein
LLTPPARQMICLGCLISGIAIGGCSTREETPLAIYGLSDRYVVLEGEGPRTLLVLRGDGSFVLSDAVTPAYGKIAPGEQLAHGTWTPTARGLALESQQWSASLHAGRSEVSARGLTVLMDSLTWAGSTSPSPVDSVAMYSWPQLSELLYPTGGSGRRQAGW